MSVLGTQHEHSTSKNKLLIALISGLLSESKGSNLHCICTFNGFSHIQMFTPHNVHKYMQVLHRFHFNAVTHRYPVLVQYLQTRSVAPHSTYLQTNLTKCSHTLSFILHVYAYKNPTGHTFCAMNFNHPVFCCFLCPHHS